jgi:hypothetical protein
MTGKQHHHGRRYDVHVDLTVPGGEVAVTHNPLHEEVHVAIRDAMDSDQIVEDNDRTVDHVGK